MRCAHWVLPFQKHRVQEEPEQVRLGEILERKVETQIPVFLKKIRAWENWSWC